MGAEHGAPESYIPDRAEIRPIRRSNSSQYRGGLLLLLLAALPAGAAWQTEVAPLAPAAGDPDLAVASTGCIHMALPLEGGLYHAEWEDGVWSLSLLAPGGELSCDIRVDGLDRPHLTWLDDGDGSLRWARRDGSTWTVETVAAEGVRDAFELAVSSTGEPCLAFLQDAYDLHLARREPEGWIDEIVAQGCDQKLECCLELDAEDRPHLIYMYQGLQYATLTQDGWVHEQIWQSYPYDGAKGCSLTLDPEGRPWVAYQRWYVTQLYEKYYYVALLQRDLDTWLVHDAHTMERQSPYEVIGLGCEDRDRIHLAYAFRGLNGPGLWMAILEEGDGNRVLLDPRDDAAEGGGLDLTPAGLGALVYRTGTELTLAREVPDLAYDLAMPDLLLEPGDTLQVHRSLENRAEDPVTVEEYLILEVQGLYWFWPSWGREVDHQEVVVPPGTSDATHLELAWPPGAGSAAGLRFWGGLADPAEGDLLAFDVVTWGFAA